MVLSCDTYTIIGNQTADTTGILITSTGGIDNVTVANCTIANWTTGGIYASNTETLTISDTLCENNSYGIYTSKTNQTVVKNCSITRNIFGITLGYEEGGNLTDCRINHNTMGVVFRNTESMNASENTVNNNTQYGLYVQVGGTAPNRIWRNVFNKTNTTLSNNHPHRTN